MEKLRDKIYEQYAEYKQFDDLVKEKNKEFALKKDDVPNLLKEGLSEDLEKVLTHLYSDMVLYNSDMQFLFMCLMTNIKTYLEVCSEELSEEVRNFYNQLKQWYPKRIFSVEKGEIVEAEKGAMEENRKKFLDSDYYKSILEQGKLLADK